MSSDNGPYLDRGAGLELGEIDELSPEPRIARRPVPDAPEPVRVVRRRVGEVSAEPRVIRRVRHAVSVPAEPVPPKEHVQFRERFAIAAARATRNGMKFVVGTVEVGCEEGDVDPTTRDALAAETCDRIKRALRQTDAVTFQPDGRLVFLAEDVDTRALDALGARMMRTLSEPITIGAQLCAPIPAVGIALWRSPDDDADGLLEDAGWELREVRRRTGKGWRIAHSTDEPQDEGASHGVRHRGFRFRAFLQRTVGWLSLLTIGWVVASYSGIERAKTLLGQIHQLLLSIPPLR